MANPYRGKSVIVTGGASGIGRALCEQLGRLGAVVVVADRDEPGAQTVASRILESGGDARAVALDVRDAGTFRALVEGTAAEHGALDYIVNNAGWGVASELRDMSIQQWRDIVDINFMGVVHGTQAAYDVMVRQRHGHIVNVASGYGLLPGSVLGAYSATKHAVVGLTESLRLEGAALGVKATVVCPGWVDTRIFENADTNAAPAGTLRRIVPFRPIDAKLAARETLKGVAKNQAHVLFPGYMRWAWRAYRVSPKLARLIDSRTLSGFRKAREEG